MTCSSVFLPAAQPNPVRLQRASNLAPWTFREDFRQGIPGWMSFPLPQDVGYDPSLYTKRVGGASVLVRDVTAYGQRVLRVGLVRQLSFHVGPSSLFRISYELEICGKTTDVRLTLAGADGRRYSRSLMLQSGVAKDVAPDPHTARAARTAPAPGAAGSGQALTGGATPGVHDVQVDGRQLGIPAVGVEVEAIVIEAEVASPVSGSHNRLTLRALEIHAERPGGLLIRAPNLDRSLVDDIAVAKEVAAAGKPLKVGLGSGAAARIAVYDEMGALVGSANIPPGEARDAQLAAPNKPGLYRVEIASPPARSEFRFLVLGEVPLHPRVLLTAQKLEQLRSQSYSNELPAIMHRRASELRASIGYNANAGQNIALLSRVSVFPGLPEYFALMDSYSNAIAFNALDFRLSGDRQALEAARRALLTVAAWPTWTPAWFAAHGLHTYYEVGVFTQRVALGYDLIADELSPEEKAKIAEAFWKNSISPTLDEYFFYDRMPIAASNHQAQSVGGAIEACVALAGDVPDWETKFGPALTELVVAFERLLEGLFPGDGSQAEPAGYEDFAMQGMSWGMAALHVLDVRPTGFEKMMEAFWWPRYAQVRPDLLLDTGDFGSDLRAHSGYAWGAEYAGDPALRAFYDTATEQSLKAVFELPHSGQAAEKVPGLLDLVCCTQPAVATPDPPLSRIFAGRGSAVLRSGWRPEDTVISLRVGPWFNHEHHDQGSFRVAAYGEELVAEAGHAHYYQDPRYADFFTQAPAHNTVVIDDDPFSQEDYDGRYWPAFQNFARFERHVFSAGIDYLSADLTPAYGDGAEVKSLRREYVFVKPATLIIHDRIEAAAPHGYSWLLHIPPGAQASLDGAKAFIRRPGALAALTAAGENRGWRIVEQPVPTIAYRDFDRISVDPRETFQLDSPRTKEAGFLVALHFQKAGEEAAPLEPQSTSSAQGFQSSDGAARILFRSKAGQLTTEDLTTDGDVLAISKVNGEDEIFSGNVKLLQRGARAIFTSDRITDVALRETPDLVEVHLFCSAVTSLKIFAKRRPSEVRLDEGLVTALQTEGFTSFERLAKGDHVVSISY